MFKVLLLMRLAIVYAYDYFCKHRQVSSGQYLAIIRNLANNAAGQLVVTLQVQTATTLLSAPTVRAALMVSI